MRIGLTSDLHGLLPPIPSDLDLLIVAGDVGVIRGGLMEGIGSGTLKTTDRFREWLEDAPCPVVGIAGNHDFGFAESPQMAAGLPWTYLQDSGQDIAGFKVWGSPWSPYFGPWAFMMRDEERLWREIWSMIPDDTEILITHGPPHGICDQTKRGINAGSTSLLKRVKELKNLKLHVFGHIHEARGVYGFRGLPIFVNASYVDLSYRPWPRPMEVIELDSPVRD